MKTQEKEHITYDALCTAFKLIPRRTQLSEILGCKELIEMFEKGTEKMTANYPLLVGIEVKESPLFPYRDQDGETIIGTILNREEGTISLIYRK